MDRLWNSVEYWATYPTQFLCHTDPVNKNMWSALLTMSIFRCSATGQLPYLGPATGLEKVPISP